MFDPKLDIFKTTLGKVRTAYDSNGDPWFLINDIGDCLDLKNVHDTFRRACILGKITPSDRATITYKQCREEEFDDFWDSISSGGSDFRQKTFVSEYGLYALIFASESQNSKEFQHWVTHEVLPSINHDGGYILDQEKLHRNEKKQLKKEIRQLHAAVAQKDKVIDKISKFVDQTDEMYEKVVSDYVSLSAKADPLIKTLSEEYKPKPSKYIEAPLGLRYDVSIKDSLVHFEEEDKDRYAVDDFYEER